LISGRFRPEKYTSQNDLSERMRYCSRLFSIVNLASYAAPRFIHSVQHF
jgi:hypothetical protein